MTARDTARTIRGDAKRRIALRVTRARADLEVSQRDLAEAAGVSRALVTHWEDPEHPATPTLADLEAIAHALPDFARRLHEPTSEALGLVSVRSEDVDPVECDFAAMGEVLEAAGELAKHHAVSSRDGIIDGDEGAEGLPLAQRAKAAAAALEYRYRLAMQERALGVLPFPGAKGSS